MAQEPQPRNAGFPTGADADRKAGVTHKLIRGNQWLRHWTRGYFTERDNFHQLWLSTTAGQFTSGQSPVHTGNLPDSNLLRNMSAAPPTRPSLLLRLRDAEDAEAWSEFVRLYTPLVFGYCQRHGLQEADAADVAQEVMRVAAGAMPEFQYDAARGRFRGWMLQTTRHRLHKFFARQRRAPQTASETTMERFLDGEPGADEQARWEEEYRQRLFDWAAEKARAEFQPATWDAFWLTAVDAISVKEVAGQLGISIGAVYIARSRVIARLRELIETVTDEPVTTLET